MLLLGRNNVDEGHNRAFQGRNSVDVVGAVLFCIAASGWRGSPSATLDNALEPLCPSSSLPLLPSAASVAISSVMGGCSAIAASGRPRKDTQEG